MLGGRRRRHGGDGRLVEEVIVVGGLLVVQCLFAGYVVFVQHLLLLGARPLSVIVLANVAFSAFSLPFAVALERKRWPSKIPATLVLQLVLIALGGTTMYQGLTFLGIKKTTPAIASAMPNLNPALIFIVAASFGLEKFDKACKYTQAKMVGTVVCVAGAMAMSLVPAVQTTTAAGGGSNSNSSSFEWMVGCSCLLAAAVVSSFSNVLQAVAMGSFPLPLTQCAVTSAMGAAFTAVLQLVLEGDLGMGSARIDGALIGGIVLLGGAMTGACMVFQTWCLGKKGPVMVSVFGPVQTVCSAILSAALFQQMLSIGSNQKSEFRLMDGWMDGWIIYIIQLRRDRADVQWAVHSSVGQEQGRRHSSINHSTSSSRS